MFHTSWQAAMNNLFIQLLSFSWWRRARLSCCESSQHSRSQETNQARSETFHKRFLLIHKPVLTVLVHGLTRHPSVIVTNDCREDFCGQLGQLSDWQLGFDLPSPVVVPAEPVPRSVCCWFAQMMNCIARQMLTLLATDDEPHNGLTSTDLTCSWSPSAILQLHFASDNVVKPRPRYDL